MKARLVLAIVLGLVLAAVPVSGCGQTAESAKLTSAERAVYLVVQRDLPTVKKAFALQSRACRAFSQRKIDAGIRVWNRSVPLHNAAARRWNKVAGGAIASDSKAGNVAQLRKDYVAVMRALDDLDFDVNQEVHPQDYISLGLPPSPEEIAKSVAKVFKPAQKKMKRLFAAVEVDLREIEANHASQ